MRDLRAGSTRPLSTEEQVLLLRNHIAFLEEEIVEKERRVTLLIDDNAEMDFLADVNERVRNGAGPEAEVYWSNIKGITELRRQIEGAREDIRTYRRVLAERFGVTV